MLAYRTAYGTRQRDQTRFPVAIQLAGPARTDLLAADQGSVQPLLDEPLANPFHRRDIDLDRLRLHLPEMRYDLPAGGKRLVQTADGYDATIVAGAVIRRHGQDTGARPGRLVRH